MWVFLECPLTGQTGMTTIKDMYVLYIACIIYMESDFRL